MLAIIGLIFLCAQVGGILAGQPHPAFQLRQVNRSDKERPQLTTVRDTLTCRPMSEREQKHYSNAMSDARSSHVRPRYATWKHNTWFWRARGFSGYTKLNALPSSHCFQSF